ncbi:I78 family peptidase inhibitor [Maritimibacter alkaliphilus]|uniref:I78 family peptidase inhibitor n=1 Tax=Maritimibacter alkaliphilus TaxID=404236 RepID=UPI001C97DE37|nr:I78 family peptidase inhibitor [Maritimibacter alkaliphilus]MBY6090691.1 hypothetical protein [Maritimibacter alkaliphilus]
MKRVICASAMVAGLAACEATGGDTTGGWPTATADQASCGADAYPATLVGSAYQAETFAAHGGPMRVLSPGDVMTMDHNPQRMNVMLDEGGALVDLRCG